MFTFYPILIGNPFEDPEDEEKDCWVAKLQDFMGHDTHEVLIMAHGDECGAIKYNGEIIFDLEVLVKIAENELGPFSRAHLVVCFPKEAKKYYNMPTTVPVEIVGDWNTVTWVRRGQGGLWYDVFPEKSEQLPM